MGEVICDNCGRYESECRCGLMEFENWYRPKPTRMERLWTILVEHTDGGSYHRHATLQSAETEAERLARLPYNVNKEVYLFECIGRCKAEQPSITWEIPR